MSGEGAIGLAPSASWTRSLAFLDPPLPSSSCPITPCSTRVPASGDERFRTLSSGGSKLVVGSADARKDKLDTVFKTALVLKF